MDAAMDRAAGAHQTERAGAAELGCSTPRMAENAAPPKVGNIDYYEPFKKNGVIKQPRMGDVDKAAFVPSQPAHADAR
jgi:hypothetical protein